MCSRFTLTVKPQLVARHFGLAHVHDFPPRYNIAPTQPVAVVRTGLDKSLELALVRWGLIPGWVKDPDEFSTLINARAETVLQKPSFRSAIKYRRCLFPISGFYEWSGPKGQRQPWYISSEKEDVLAVAGIWEHWMGAEGSEMESAAMITCAANEDIASLHDRMPVFIAPEHYDEWLDCLDGQALAASRLLRPAARGVFNLRQVSTKVNNPRNSGPELLEPVGQRDLF